MSDTHNISDPSDETKALEQAILLHQQGHLDAAMPIYRQVLKSHPEHPDALHYLGLASHSSGDVERAITYIQKAVSVAPTYVEALNNLGVIYQQADNLEGAEHCYRKVIEIRPEHSDSHNNLGVILRCQRRLQDAGFAFHQALKFDPFHARAQLNLGLLYRQIGHPEEAITHFRAAVKAGLTTIEARRALVTELYKIGKHEEAISTLEEWLQFEPDNPIALHLKSAVGEERAPARASDAFVKTVFDAMAERYDEHLDDLGYCVPELLITALNATDQFAENSYFVLDAGCGTGLCGRLIKPVAARLEGVDLSTKMLRLAKATGVYDELHEAELTTFLQQHPDTYDIIICADTLCYFGDLEEVTQAAAAALQRNGCFVFTVEQLDQDAPQDYVLNPKGRYSHGQEYILQVLEKAGFVIEMMDVEILRKESGEDVNGLVVNAKIQ